MAFNTVASTGSATNKVLRGRPYASLYVTFDNDLEAEIKLAVEASTSRLHAFGNLYLYAGTKEDRSSSASPPTGSKLKCSVPGCRFEDDIVYGEPGSDDEGLYTMPRLVCDSGAERWSNFYTRVYTGSPHLQWLGDIGSADATGDATLTFVDFLIEAIWTSL
ncbi:hypothetical protein QQZ08_005477 [Neonectria magnoliae]|uniref:Uncharacterized protein n=1 Tax=Neonectria magnoliae TaxID=2732573 RepID=A0ABR1I4V7_9HYPO